MSWCWGNGTSAICWRITPPTTMGCARTSHSTRIRRSIDLRRQSGVSHQSLGSAVSIGTTFGRQSVGTAAETTVDGGMIDHVPKIVLVSRLQALPHQGKLKIHRDLTEAVALVRELQDFRLQYTGSSMTFNARSGKRDDLVLALAVAVWRCGDGGMKSASMYHYAARQARAFEPPRTVIGLDLGQSHDYTAIAI